MAFEQDQNQASKAEVQTTKLNRMPAENAEDTEFAVEPAAEAAQAFQQNGAAANRQAQQPNQQQQQE